MNKDLLIKEEIGRFEKKFAHNCSCGKKHLNDDEDLDEVPTLIALNSFLESSLSRAYDAGTECYSLCACPCTNCLENVHCGGNKCAEPTLVEDNK